MDDQGKSSAAQPVQDTSVQSPDRAELLSRARSFLASPQVQLQDSDAKRAFLAEKGLNPGEVNQLLRELPPSVPPRAYPVPPPSNLPNLFVAVARIFTRLIGTSAIVFFLYYRFLLPKLAQSYDARLALRKHQSVLIARLTESAFAFKATQAESYRDLPRTASVYEDPRYAQCHAIDDLLSRVDGSPEGAAQPGDIPDITILRCALEELGRSKPDGTSTEQLFCHLESKFPWLDREDGAARQTDLWNELNACPVFVSCVPRPDATSPLPLDHPSRLLWKYAPSPVPPTPLLSSLANLQAVLPRSREAASATVGVSAKQRTLQVLSDFTGYITTQTYTLGFPSIRSTNGVASSGNPVEDELRREIRALKGFVLSRRSFLPVSVGLDSTLTPRSPEA